MCPQSLEILKDVTVLFVEDDANVREPMTNAVKSLFKNFIVATDGDIGLKLYKENEIDIDIVITDISMPNLDGIEMIKEIKKTNPLIDFIIVTAQNDTEYLLSAIELNANHYALKPLKIQSLLEKTIEIVKVKHEKQVSADKEKFLNMSELISNIAHQWRQPLSAISTTASSIKIDNELGLFDKDSVLNKVEIIEHKAQYLSEIINTFGKLVEESCEPKKVILQDVVDNVISIERNNLKDHNIKLYNDIDYDNLIKPTIVAGKLEQVLIDIINNAIEIMNEKNIEDKWIKINIESYENIATIMIEDNGGGIPKDILPKIFDPYFTTKHQSQGAGLGLHVCYKVISESLGGKLYVQNTQNGAKFFIQFPLIERRRNNRRNFDIQVEQDRRVSHRRSQLD